MSKGYFFKTIVVFSVSLIVVMATSLSLSFFFRASCPKPESIYKVTHIVNTSLDPLFSRLISLEIRVVDTSPSTLEGSVTEVTLDHQKLFIKPPDPTGDRGRSYFRLNPGKYVIRWKVQLSQENWPKTEEYKQEIILKKTDLWRYITIHGKKIEIR